MDFEVTGVIVAGIVIAAVMVLLYIRSKRQERAKSGYNPHDLRIDIHAVAKRMMFCAQLLGIFSFIAGVLMLISSFSRGEAVMFPVGIIVMLSSVLEISFFTGMAYVMVKAHEIGASDPANSRL